MSSPGFEPSPYGTTIVTSVQEESDPVDDEIHEDEDNNNNESSKGPSNADAFPALETGMEWYGQQSEGRSPKKRRCTIVQRKLSDYSPQ
ncbi:hypothetical protein TNCV_1893081 [Trichonephila clavipes]|nr:hypothetical protein TNCV_1893081 [Trichonephila clavipes]